MKLNEVLKRLNEITMAAAIHGNATPFMHQVAPSEAPVDFNKVLRFQTGSTSATSAPTPTSLDAVYDDAENDTSNPNRVPLTPKRKKKKSK